MAGSQTGSPGATRTVRIVYEIDGVEGAVTDQESLEGALQRTGEALGEQSERVERVESALGSLSDVATRSEQVQQRLHQQIQALAGGLSGLAGILGTESEAGALVGRMGQFASVGIQLGSIFGPGGAVVGGIVGGVIPALESLATSAERAASEEERLTAMVDTQAVAYDDLLAAIRRVNAERSREQTLAMGLGSLEEQQAAVELQERTLQNLNRTAEALGRMAASEENLRALGAIGEARALTERRLAAAREALGLAQSDAAADAEDFMASGEMPGRASERGRGGRRGGGGARRERDVLGELMQRAAGGSDAVGFAAGLDAADVSGRPSDFDVEAADMQRQGRNRRFGGQTQAEIRAVQQLADKQKEAHEAQMERISQQVEAWADAGQKIGGTIYNAFTTAVSGQESFEVAMVKGFKNLAVQFGGQMVNEGIAALLTAVGNTVANPPVAATKAAEGAGKLALGIGLGAAGAAIPIPSAGGGQQAKPPRLGPQSEMGSGGASVVVNMNAPSVVAGSTQQVGRMIGRTLQDARQRYGRV